MNPIQTHSANQTLMQLSLKRNNALQNNVNELITEKEKTTQAVTEALRLLMEQKAAQNQAIATLQAEQTGLVQVQQSEIATQQQRILAIKSSALSISPRIEAIDAQVTLLQANYFRHFHTIPTGYENGVGWTQSSHSSTPTQTKDTLLYPKDPWEIYRQCDSQIRPVLTDAPHLSLESQNQAIVNLHKQMNDSIGQLNNCRTAIEAVENTFDAMKMKYWNFFAHYYGHMHLEKGVLWTFGPLTKPYDPYQNGDMTDDYLSPSNLDL